MRKAPEERRYFVGKKKGKNCPIGTIENKTGERARGGSGRTWGPDDTSGRRQEGGLRQLEERPAWLYTAELEKWKGSPPKRGRKPLSTTIPGDKRRIRGKGFIFMTGKK